MTYSKIIPLMFVAVVAIGVSFMASAVPNVTQKYNDSCATCHDIGTFDAAPKIGDKAKWDSLKAQKGMATLVDNVKNGMPQMPAGGLCNDCSDADYQALIEFMATAEHK